MIHRHTPHKIQRVYTVQYHSISNLQFMISPKLFKTVDILTRKNLINRSFNCQLNIFRIFSFTIYELMQNVSLSECSFLVH